MTDDAELNIDPRPVDPATIIRGRRFSVSNYTRTAMVDRVTYDGSKPRCEVRGATEAMLIETEARLGFRLPSALRALYAQRNGASVDSFWIAKTANPRPVFDDWEDAFAYDYNDLRPLDELRTLHSIYMEDFDPEYDEDQREFWFPESEKIVILTQRYGCGTALDYRFGDEPGVVIFDLERVGDERVRLRLDSFDAFIAALRREWPKKRAAMVAVDELPNAATPDRFWCVDTYAATHGASRESWCAAGERLDVVLPPELFPFFAAVNGGNTRFLLDAQQAPHDEDYSARGPVPDGWSFYAAALHPIERWISLRELSDRIAFDSTTAAPWSERWRAPEKLVVICVSFEQALMLDYRDSEQPAVVFARDLDAPNQTISYGSVSAFLSRLRPARRGAFELFPAIGDPRLSARAASHESLWQMLGEAQPASDTLIQRCEKKFGELPETLVALYRVQNGGEVKFRFHPPEIVNISGYRNEDITASEWIDFLPAALQPMERWISLDGWAKKNKLRIDYTDICASSMKYSSDVKFQFVVLCEASGERAIELTLLDLSSSYFNREQSLIRVRYVLSEQKFEVLVEQKMLEHVSVGVLQRLRALRDEA